MVDENKIKLYKPEQKHKTTTRLPSGLLPQGDLSAAYADPIVTDILK